MPTHEPELTAPVSLCLPDGRLDPSAVGWSRQPLHHCALPGAWGRRKRWDYWCITAEPLVIQLTLLDADFLCLATAAVFDAPGDEVLEGLAVRGPGAWVQPDGVGGPARAAARSLHVETAPVDGGTRLSARFSSHGRLVQVRAFAERGGESLSVVVPWSERRYQYTSKHVGRPCRGTVRIDGKERRFEGTAALDFGRGRWPWRTRWNWGAGFGEVDGHAVGLQIGGQWTDGTGMTENGVFLDGKLDKLGDTLRFEPGPVWRITSVDSDRVDLRFRPVKDRPLWIPGLCRLELVFGHWEGTVAAHGRVLRVDGLFGWTEEMSVFW